MTMGKQVIVEGTVSATTWNGFGIDGAELGSEDKYRFKVYNKGNANFRDVKLDARVRITIEILPEAVP